MIKPKCPCCKGEGSCTDYILYVGIGGGPTYDCAYCNGEGKVGIVKYLQWVWWTCRVRRIFRERI